MFEHTSNSFIFGAAAALALILWLDSRTGRPRGLSYAGQNRGSNDEVRPRGPGEGSADQSARSIEPAPHPEGGASQPPQQS